MSLLVRKYSNRHGFSHTGDSHTEQPHSGGGGGGGGGVLRTQAAHCRIRCAAAEVRAVRAASRRSFGCARCPHPPSVCAPPCRDVGQAGYENISQLPTPMYRVLPTHNISSSCCLLGCAQCTASCIQYLEGIPYPNVLRPPYLTGFRAASQVQGQLRMGVGDIMVNW